MAEYIKKEPFLDKLLYMGYFDDNDEIKNVADDFSTNKVLDMDELTNIYADALRVKNGMISINTFIESLDDILEAKGE